jgi:L-alanine-DL-glutamate epimerase-like enolase superfamily enzyme
MVSIQQVEIYQSPVKLKEPFVISLGPLYHAENIIVVIRTSEGIAGFGECSPFMTINGESMQTCFIVAQYLAAALKEKDALNIEACNALMDKVIYGNSSIKSAFDIALFDIASQHAGMPLYKFLGGENSKALITDYTVSLGEVAKMVNDAVQIKEAGFQVIKVKLGQHGAKDVERIRKIREAIGTDLPLRIDANQGWTPDAAIEILNELSIYNIQHCEEPVPRWDYMELPRIRKNSTIPIMADESCFDHHDAKRLIAIKACDLFNIKLGKSSGIYNAKKIIALAEQQGMKIQVGGFLESRLGFTAAAHLALSSDHIVYCDFDTPLMFEEDPVSGGITYGKGGMITVPDAPGLGATVDQHYLKHLKTCIV